MSYLNLDGMNEIADKIKEAFDNVATDISNLNQHGVIVSQEYIEDSVSDWLDDHPEAVTTILDGSVTSEKLGSDVTALINGKANTSALPTKTSDLTNDSGFITSSALPHIERGQEQVTISKANTYKIQHVTFATAYSSAPTVILTKHTKVPAIIHVGVSDVTTTGFDMYVIRTNTTTTYVNWMAIGV